MQTREQWFDERLETLTAWAKGASLALWRSMDASRVRESYAALLPGFLAVHEQLVVEALDAVDLYMFMVAADGGWRYDVTWQDDRPERVRQTYRGEDVVTAYLRVPLIVLSRVKEGWSTDDAMLSGWSYIVGIVGTEAHEIARNVTADRVAG